MLVIICHYLYFINSDYYERLAFYLLPGTVRLCFFSSGNESVEMHVFIHSVLGSSLKVKFFVYFKMDTFTCRNFVTFFILQLPAQVGFRSMLQILVEGKAL